MGEFLHFVGIVLSPAVFVLGVAVGIALEARFGRQYPREG